MCQCCSIFDRNSCARSERGLPNWPAIRPTFTTGRDAAKVRELWRQVDAGGAQRRLVEAVEGLVERGAGVELLLDALKLI